MIHVRKPKEMPERTKMMHVNDFYYLAIHLTYFLRYRFNNQHGPSFKVFIGGPYLITTLPASPALPESCIYQSLITSKSP